MYIASTACLRTGERVLSTLHFAGCYLRPVWPMVARAAYAMLLLVPVCANSQWRIAPTIGLGIEYDDNAVLVADSALDPSVTGWIAEADAQFLYNSQLTEFVVTPRVHVNRYSDDQALDSEDYFVDLDYKYTTQRARFRVRGNYADESVRTAERSDVDWDVDNPSEIPTDDSGEVLSLARRERVFVAPEWSFQFGQRSRIALGASYLDATYTDQVISTLDDFTETTGNLGLTFDRTERSRWLLSTYYRLNDFSESDQEFEGKGATVGFSYDFSERTTLQVDAGADSTDDEFGTSYTKPIGMISMIHSLDTTRVIAAYRRTVSGSGESALSVRDSINVTATRELNERLSVGAGVYAYQMEPVQDDADSDLNQDYFQFRTTLSWKLTQALSLDLDYHYTYLDRQISDSDADSNRINLWLKYHPIL